MQTVTRDEAKTHLTALIDAATAGEEIFITKGTVAVQLVPLGKATPAKPSKRHFGSAKGLVSMAADFDETLEDFKEYQQ
jgi:antitoxin (DNA-binding transcriptional repressor) of toxin-antitoxin stability system